MSKNGLKTAFFVLLALPLFLFANVSVAKADIFSEMEAGVSTFVEFIVRAFSAARNGSYVSPSVVISGQASSSDASTSTDIFSLFSIPGIFAPSAVPTVYIDTSSSTQNVSVDTFAPVPPTTVNAPVSIPTATTSPSLPGGLSGSTEQNGVSLNDSEIIYWTNIERGNNGGLTALDENNTLDTIAAIRVADMFAKQYFDHYSPTGDNVAKEADANGYGYVTIGENIAEGNFGSSRDLVTAWMNSPGHRANILNGKYTEIGVAAEQGMYQGSQVWIASQVFGEPLADCPSPDASVKQQISDDQNKAAGLMSQITAAKAELAADANDPSAYNAETAVYNDLATQYNALVAEMKTLAAEYNQQVAAFNSCIQ